MLTECSPNAHSLARSLFGQPRHGRNSMLQKLCLRHLSERGSGGPVLVMGGSDWGSWREEDFLRLTRTWGPGGLRGPSSMLVCRANPPVWSCRVGRLPAMQLDGRQKWERGGIRSLVFQPPGSNCQLAASRGAIMVVSHRGCERVGRVKRDKRDKRHLTVRDCRCSCAQKSVWGRLWRGSPV